ncbi:putative membrane protein YeaQ/YmgE (transglycosylase-associated protein family) [Rhodoblastus acidophilus]|uniref:hypothetical protein n=1 Tax=Rhodoblastus acidophilus TaxID=1074 RepID=UPI0022248A1B|nr:hypothetical protein [Rhodoblastus acidophilus]MCW2286468.1 putative membrane protein YeaQ/YmgE (transglycosylase-associated protein family) [Rhodoblastus acidophilus]MCW2335344.1 putative membrane protein YeaQ/YmgE (transglycosylase-associated protein family) [Rhodoblastus acidophilus]
MFSPRHVFVFAPVFFLAGGLPALAQAYGGKSSVPGLDALVHLLGYDGLQADQRDLIALLLIVFGLLFGYFSHLAFRENGFGFIFNGVIGLVGAGLGFYAFGPKFGLLSQVHGGAHDFLLAVLAAGAAVPVLVLAMMVAGGLRRGLTNFVYGRLRRDMDAKRAAMVEPELPRRVAQFIKK